MQVVPHIDQLPTLKSERLILKQRGIEDIDHCVEMDSDPEVQRFWAEPFRDKFSPEDHRRYLQGRIGYDFGIGFGYWSVLDRADLTVYHGWVFLKPIGDGPSEIEIGWRFKRASWGRGIATEASREVLQYGFFALNLENIVAVIVPGNSRSEAVARRLGFRFAGTKIAYRSELLLYRVARKNFRSTNGT